MRTNYLMVCLALAVLATSAHAAEPVETVMGGGTYKTTAGQLDNHQPVIDSVTINATLYDDFSAEGNIVWMGTYNGRQDPGKGTSGWTWQIEVDSWWLNEDGSVTVWGTVRHSQLKHEIGAFTAVNFYDGGGNNSDFINGNEIDGNIRFIDP